MALPTPNEQQMPAFTLWCNPGAIELPVFGLELGIDHGNLSKVGQASLALALSWLSLGYLVARTMSVGT